MTTKWPKEETKAELEARIQEASRYLPLERLALSTQCGFASIAGKRDSREAKKRKLELVARVARRVWES